MIFQRLNVREQITELRKFFIELLAELSHNSVDKFKRRQSHITKQKSHSATASFMGFLFVRSYPNATNYIEYDRGDGEIGIIEEHNAAAPQQLEKMYDNTAECFVEESTPTIIASRDNRKHSTKPCARFTQPSDDNSVPSATNSTESTTTATFLPIVNMNSLTPPNRVKVKDSVDSQGNTTKQPHAELHSQSEEYAYTGPVDERWPHDSARHTIREVHNDQETDLSQSDMNALDNLFSILPMQDSPTNSYSSLEVELPGLSVNRDTRLSARDTPANIATFHSFETFVAIGQMQMEQSLVANTEQNNEYATSPSLTPQPGITTQMGLGLFVTMPSILGWLWCLWIAVASHFSKAVEAGKPITYVTANEADPLGTINLNLSEPAPSDMITIGVTSRVTHDIASIEAPFIDANHRGEDVASCCPLAELTNVEQTPTLNDKAAAVYLQQVQETNIDNDRLGIPQTITAVPLNLALMIGLILVYVLMPRKCRKTERDFGRLSIQELQQECKKRGLPPSSSIRQDLIVRLCENDGIYHSFTQIKIHKYTTLNKMELQLALQNLGANISGKKQDLQNRLVLAREAFYKALTDDELQRIARHCDSMENPKCKCSSKELARRLAEAGPQIPLRAVD